MIPEFDDNGYLPPGIHPATMQEIAERFGKETELRRVQMESLTWLVGSAKKAGIHRIVVNGSFVTDIMEPNDVDCILLIERGYPKDPQGDAELEAGFPFIDFHRVGEDDFRVFVEEIFGTDRKTVPKGVIEVIL